ncbi:MAG: hypothetical protein KDJ47_02375 [Hyphomicrobiaceae bacterium]|nr:hypothetical protein [Hyphomicrobiaceae bacterium]
MNIARSIATAAVALMSMAGSVIAAPVLADNVDTATQRALSLFKQTCYETMPDVGAVERAAEINGWEELTGAQLAAFKPNAEPKTLRAWRFKDEGLSFAVSIAVTPVDATITDLLPELTGGTAYSCSVLPQRVDHAATTGALAELVGRPFQAEFETGPLKARMWAGSNDQFAAFLYHYRPAAGGRSGLLNFTAIPKP